MYMLSSIAMITGLLAAAPIDQPKPSTPNQATHQITDLTNPSPSFEVISDNEIIADGHAFQSWDELYQAGYFNFEDTRCKTSSEPIPNPNGQPNNISRGGNDCTYDFTNPSPQYEPSVAKYRIPVVVHIIERTNGTGAMSDERVRSQIDVLNEDFGAMSGSNGEEGVDTQIEFYLATQDPDGNATSGITRSVNDTWFNDGGRYYNTLAWDTDRYLNIYSNSASGALGYTQLPQGGIAGSRSDRVVILYSTFGLGAPFVPYNLGRTATHEVGHYLGLYHTFDFGCDSGSCDRSGDRICDTNPVGSPTSGCPSSRTSCGQQVPIHNYMDYSDDRCMNQFTADQANRMRCSMINYRPQLFSIVSNEPCSVADYAEPMGVLDFFDVAFYLDAFRDQEPAADITGDGVWDFFDISDFIDAFGAGCP